MRRGRNPPRSPLARAEDWRETIQLTHGQLVDYMLSQSNAIAAIAAGSTTEGRLRTWLLTETERFLPNEQRPQGFPYWGSLAALQRT